MAMGSETRDYVYVGDVVRAHVLALDTLKGSDIFNISTAKETDVNEIFDILSKPHHERRGKTKIRPRQSGRTAAQRVQLRSREANARLATECFTHGGPT